MGFAQIVVADPPWFFNPRRNTGTRFGLGISDKYPPMTEEQICSLPVKDLLDDRALVFLWSTWAHLDQALRVLDAWGTKYVSTPFIWRKVSAGGETRGLPGYYSLTSTEPVLLGRRGSPSFKPQHMFKQDLPAPITRHSEKPEAFFQQVEKMYRGLTKVELFARKSRDAWAVWGNQVDSTPAVCDILGYPKRLEDSIYGKQGQCQQDGQRLDGGIVVQEGD